MFGLLVVMLVRTHQFWLIGFQHSRASSECESLEVEEPIRRRLPMPEKGLKRPRSEVKVKLKKVHPEGCYVCAVTRSTRFYHLPDDINDFGHVISEPMHPDSLVLCDTCRTDVQQMRKVRFRTHPQEVRPWLHMRLIATTTA